MMDADVDANNVWSQLKAFEFYIMFLQNTFYLSIKICIFYIEKIIILEIFFYLRDKERGLNF